MPERIKKVKKIVSSLLAEGSDFHAEIDKSGDGFRVLVSGVRRVTELSEKSLSLKCPHHSLKIKGDTLSLSLYEDKSVEISGKLEVIEFANTKN